MDEWKIDRKVGRKGSFELNASQRDVDRFAVTNEERWEVGHFQ